MMERWSLSKKVLYIGLSIPLLIPILLIVFTSLRSFWGASPTIPTEKIVHIPLKYAPNDKSLQSISQQIDQILKQFFLASSYTEKANIELFEQYARRILNGEAPAITGVLALGKKESIAFVILGSLSTFGKKVEASIRILNVRQGRIQKLEIASPLEESSLPIQIASQIIQHIKGAGLLDSIQDETAKDNRIRWLSFLARDIKGNRILGKDLYNKIVLIVFFSTTCPQCLVQSTALTALQQKYKDQDVVIIGISTNTQDKEQLTEFVQRRGITYPVIIDEGRIFYRLWHAEKFIQRQPYTIVIDKEGVTRFIHQGYSEPQKVVLDAEIQFLLGTDSDFHLDSQSYAGVAVCSVCHSKEYQDWLVTPHAKAFSALEEKQQQSEECVACHVTGFKQTGGYDFEYPWESEHLKGVQCEACHGAGGGHSEKQKVIPMDFKAICLKCHKPKYSLNFDYERAVKLVNHSLAANTEEQRLEMIEDYQSYRFHSSGRNFVGTVECISCHTKEYQAWKESPHAHALDTLKQKRAEREASCVRCHTTGFGSSGGYIIGAEKFTKGGVGCESCYGPGESHIQAPLELKKQTIIRLGDKCSSCVVKSICTTCHTSERDPNFNLESDLEKIKH